MTRSSYNIPLYWLIQLASFLSLSTLTPGYALETSDKTKLEKQLLGEQDSEEDKAPSDAPQPQEQATADSPQQEEQAREEEAAKAKEEEAKKARAEEAEKARTRAAARARAEAKAKAEEEAAKAKAEEEAAKARAEEEAAKARAEEEAAKAKAEEEAAKAKAEEEAAKAKAEEEAAKAKAEEEAAKAKAEEEAAKAKAEEEAAASIQLKVDSSTLEGPNNIVQVTVTNRSLSVADLAKCRLDIQEIEGKQLVEIYYRTRASGLGSLSLPAKPSPLTNLIDVKKLQPGASQTCAFYLNPNGNPNVKLSFRLLEGNLNPVGNRVDVNWSAKVEWNIRKLLPSSPSSWFSTIYSGLSFAHLWEMVVGTKPVSVLNKVRNLFDVRNYWSPKLLTYDEIYEKLRKVIVGQEEALATLASLGEEILEKLQRPRWSLPRWGRQPSEDKEDYISVFLVGPSGVGKTHIVRKFIEALGLPFVEEDASRLTAPGYVGGNLEDVVKRAEKKRVRGIPTVIYLDEFDKLNGLQGGNSSSLDVIAKVQDGLLKLIESGRFIVICSGAFSDVEELSQIDDSEIIDTLHNVGRMKLELLYRFSDIVRLSMLQAEDFIEMWDLPNSPITRPVQDLQRKIKAELIFSNLAKVEIITKAMLQEGGGRSLAKVTRQYLTYLKNKLDKNQLEGLIKDGKLEITSPLLEAIAKNRKHRVKTLSGSYNSREKNEDIKDEYLVQAINRKVAAAKAKKAAAKAKKAAAKAAAKAKAAAAAAAEEEEEEEEEEQEEVGDQGGADDTAAARRQDSRAKLEQKLAYLDLAVSDSLQDNGNRPFGEFSQLGLLNRMPPGVAGQENPTAAKLHQANGA